MALRFTDTTKWQDEWWQSLPNDYRIIYQYLQDHCNIAGIIRREFRLMNFQCGTNVTPESFFKIFGGRVIEIPNSDYWLLRNFCKNQYPKGLNSEKPMIKGVRQLAEKYNVLDIINDSYTNHSLMISQSLTNDIGNGNRIKEKGNIEKVSKIEKFTPPTPDQVTAFVKEKIPNAPDVFCKSFAEKFCGHYESVGWKVGKNPMKSWEGAVNKWSPTEAFQLFQEKNKSHKQFNTEKTKL